MVMPGVNRPKERQVDLSFEAEMYRKIAEQREKSPPRSVCLYV